MISLKRGSEVAFILDDKSKKKDLKKVYIYGDQYEMDIDEITPELDTTIENKTKIFKNFLLMNPRLTKRDIDSMIVDFKNKEEYSTNDKLSRAYDNALQFVKRSLCNYIDFGQEEELFPYLDISTRSARIFISGSSGSGKSVWIGNFLKYNALKNQPIFMFTPFGHDIAFDKIPNLEYVDLDEFESKWKRPFEFQDIMQDSIVVMDDIESHETRSKELIKLRNILLERGRHHRIEDGKKIGPGVTVLSVSHQPLSGAITKKCLAESGHFVFFPKTNSQSVTAVLDTYLKYTTQQIKEILNSKSRWVFVSKIPSYFVSQHSIRLF